jgi:hypothetical protein
MVCLSLAYWEAIAVWVIVVIAVIALLRLLVIALGGGAAFWPPVSNPMSPTGPSPSGLVGFLAAALNIVIWAILMIAIIYLIFSLLSCLIGSVGILPRLPR